MTAPTRPAPPERASDQPADVPPDRDGAAVSVRPAAYGRPQQSTLRRPIGRIRVPQNRLARIALGVALVFGGLLGFLPILGFWMIPLGLYVLSFDFPRVLRFRRRSTVWLGRHWQLYERRPAVQRALVKLGLR